MKDRNQATENVNPPPGHTARLVLKEVIFKEYARENNIISKSGTRIHAGQAKLYKN